MECAPCSWLCWVVPLNSVCGFGGGGRPAGGIPWAGSTPLPACTAGLMCRYCHGKWWELLPAWAGVCSVLSLHPGVRFQHLLALHRGKVLRVCPSKLCPCPLRSSSFSKECKQTPESSFLPLCYKPGSCVPLCLGSLACLVVFPKPQTTSSSCNSISLLCPSCVLAPGSWGGSWWVCGR